MYKLTAGGTEYRDEFRTEEAALQALGRLAAQGKDVSNAQIVEFDPCAEAVAEIVAEMERRPDAQRLVKWIDQNLWSTGSSDPILGAIAKAINTYFVALDEQG